MPVSDGVGEIAALGEGVDGWAVGDRVIPHFMPNWQDGTMTSASFAATTAWRAVRSARLGPHSTALLLGTGGVSIFALQFAKAHGARVIVTSSSDEKLERARKLGADLTINYRNTPEWDAEALRLTDGHGADLELETGGTETFARSVNAAAMACTVFVIGFLNRPYGFTCSQISGVSAA